MKNYLIAGASSGIGRGVAKMLSDDNTTIILVAREEEKLKRVQEELSGNSIVIPCDVTKNEDIKRVFDKLETEKVKLDGLVYCAGMCFLKTLKMMKSTDLEDMFRVNVFGFYEMCRHFSKVSVSNKNASIVGISSYAAVTKEAGLSAYAMSKGAMDIQVQALSKEFIRRKIRINSVVPARVKSKMDSDNNDWTDEEIALVNEKHPLGIIPIDDVVKAVEFLMSDAARHITGESLCISSGYHS